MQPPQQQQVMDNYENNYQPSNEEYENYMHYFNNQNEMERNRVEVNNVSKPKEKENVDYLNYQNENQNISNRPLSNQPGQDKQNPLLGNNNDYGQISNQNQNDKKLAYKNNHQNYPNLGDYEESLKKVKNQQTQVYKNYLDQQMNDRQNQKLDNKSKQNSANDQYDNPYSKKNYDFGKSNLTGNIISNTNVANDSYSHGRDNKGRLRQVGNNIIG